MRNPRQVGGYKNDDNNTFEEINTPMGTNFSLRYRDHRQILRIQDTYEKLSSLKANPAKTKFLAINFTFSEYELVELENAGFKRENLMADSITLSTVPK